MAGTRCCSEDAWKACFSRLTCLFVFAIVLLIFGPKELPDLGHGLSTGIRELEDAVRGPVDVTPDVEK